MTVPAKPGSYKKNDTSGWSFTAAEGNAIINKGGWALYAKCHTWFSGSAEKGESGYPETKESYSLPTFKLSGGDITLFKSGVQAASGRVQGAGGGIKKIPQSDFPAVKGRLASLAKEFDMVPPWEKKKSELLKEIDESLTGEALNDFAVFDIDELMVLRKTIEGLPDDEPDNTDDQDSGDRFEIPELKKSVNLLEYQFGFEALEKSPKSPTQKEALSLSAVKTFLKSRGEFNPDELVIIHGFGSSGKVDRDRDEVDPSAWEGSLGAYMKSPTNGVVLRQHNLDRPVGRLLYAKSIKDKGPYLVAYIDEPETVRDIRDKKIGAFSYYANPKSALVDYAESKKVTKELDLYELSVVTIPANTDAAFTLIKTVKKDLRITGIEEITEEQEKELGKGIFKTIKNILGIKPKESDEQKLIKSIKEKTSRWQAEIDEIEGSTLFKSGAKMAKNRLERYRKAFALLKEVLTELEGDLKDVEAEFEKSKLKKSVVKTEVEQMELHELEAVLDKKLDPITNRLNELSTRQEALEKATENDSESVLKKSIKTEFSSLMDEKLQPFTDFNDKFQEWRRSVDEDLKNIKKTKSPSRLGGNGNEQGKSAKKYEEMSVEEQEEFWDGTV